MTHSAKEFDLVVVGAGLVGASLACAIASLKGANRLKIALVEAAIETKHYADENFDPRVVSLTHASQNLLSSIGVWQKIIATRACAYQQMHVWDGEGTAEIHFDCADVRADHLGHIVENSVLVAALHEKISEHANIELIHPARVMNFSRDIHPMIELDSGIKLTTKLLIAADGAHSKIRELTEFETREWDYGHTAIVTTVQTELPHQATAWQRFMPSGPLAFLPLNHINQKHFCSIVWSADHALAEELMALDNVEFCNRLGRAFEFRLGNVLSVSERFAIPLKQRHAKTYIQPQIVLVGDAAHNIHPLAGQGVNLGLLDVRALTQEIERALERSISLDDISILRRYQRARLAGNLTMMSVMEAFKQLFASKSLWMNWLRNMGMRQLNSIESVKKIIIKTAMGID